MPRTGHQLAAQSHKLHALCTASYFSLSPDQAEISYTVQIAQSCAVQKMTPVVSSPIDSTKYVLTHILLSIISQLRQIMEYSSYSQATSSKSFEVCSHRGHTFSHGELAVNVHRNVHHERRKYLQKIRQEADCYAHTSQTACPAVCEHNLYGVLRWITPTSINSSATVSKSFGTSSLQQKIRRHFKSLHRSPNFVYHAP